MSETKNNKPEKKRSLFKFLTNFNSKDPAENILKCCLLGAFLGTAAVVAATGIGLAVGGTAAVAAFGLTGVTAMKFIVAMTLAGVMSGSTMELVSLLLPEKKQEKNPSHLKSVIRQQVKNSQNANVRQADKTHAQGYERPISYETGQVLNYTATAPEMETIDATRNATETSHQKVEKPVRKQLETRRNQPPSARGHKDFVR